MANIPTVALSEVQSAPGLGPRASADAFNAPNRAITAAGGAVQDVSGMLGRFALQKQDQVNRGLLAGEEAVRMQTAAQIDEHVRNNPDKPETWGKFADATWRGYERAKSSRAKAQGWGPAVLAQDKLIDQGYRAEFGVKFAAEVDKGMIRQSNARLESLATMQLAEGDVGAALASVDAMTLFPEQRQAKVEALTNGAVYGQYDREMSDISTLPPAEQVREFGAIEAELVAVDDAGKPISGWVEGDDGKRLGGLNQSARTDLIRAARARKRAAETRIEGEVNRLLGVYIGAGADEFNRQAKAAFEQGAVQAEIVADKVGLGFSAQAKGEAGATMRAFGEGSASVLTREAAAREVEARRSASEAGVMTRAEKAMREKAQDWRTRAMRGTLTAEAVELAVKRGEVMQDDGEALLATIRARSELDTFKATMGPVYGQKDFVDRITKYASMTNEQKDDISLAQRMAMLAMIDDDAALGAEAKAGVMRTYLDALNVDLQGWEEDGEVVRPHINGREINAAEARSRAQVGRAFRLAPNLGEGWAGTAMIRAEKELTAFFDSETYRDDEAHAKLAGQLVDKIRGEVSDLAASRLMGGLYQ